MTTRPSDSLLSVAAISPSSGLPPAPRPRVTCSPIWHLLGASELTSACASVFRAQNSTPYVATFLSQSVLTIEARFHRLPSTQARRTIHRTPSSLARVSRLAPSRLRVVQSVCRTCNPLSIIRFTAFPPPPPHPITLIFAPPALATTRAPRVARAPRPSSLPRAIARRPGARAIFIVPRSRAVPASAATRTVDVDVIARAPSMTIVRASECLARAVPSSTTRSRRDDARARASARSRKAREIPAGGTRRVVIGHRSRSSRTRSNGTAAGRPRETTRARRRRTTRRERDDDEGRRRGRERNMRGVDGGNVSNVDVRARRTNERGGRDDVGGWMESRGLVSSRLVRRRGARGETDDGIRGRRARN